MPIERIEVYLDGGAEPVQVLTQPPFKVTYDTRSLTDGEHQLRVVTHYVGGAKEVKEIPFKVANTPGVLVEGLEEGKEVTGTLDITLRVADPEVKPAREKFPGLAAALATAVILGGIWLFFAATGVTDQAVEELAKPPAVVEEVAPPVVAPAPVAVDAAVMAKGEAAYTAHCAACHQPTGRGIPGVFPPLAAGPNMANHEYTINITLRGKGAMPGFAHLTDEEVAAVLTFTKNSWGNNFGAVTPEQVAALR